MRAAVGQTRPRRPGERNRRVFDFARLLKTMPEHCGKRAADLEPAVRAWWQVALPVIRTKDFAETWADFCVAWEQVRTPAGATFAAAVARIPAGLGRRDRLAAICVELGRLHPSGEFPLSSRKAGDVLGCSHVAAAKWLNRLVAEGFIRLVSEGDRAKRLAAVYKLTGSIIGDGPDG